MYALRAGFSRAAQRWAISAHVEVNRGYASEINDGTDWG